MRIIFAILFTSGVYAFLRCPKVNPVDCDTCDKFSTKCKRHLKIAKQCRHFCKLDELKCPNVKKVATCDECEAISKPCQRRLALRANCQTLCDRKVACTMMIPGDCNDCANMDPKCRKPHAVCKECKPAVACPMMVPGSCDDCKTLSAKCQK